MFQRHQSYESRVIHIYASVDATSSFQPSAEANQKVSNLFTLMFNSLTFSFVLNVVNIYVSIQLCRNMYTFRWMCSFLTHSLQPYYIVSTLIEIWLSLSQHDYLLSECVHIEHIISNFNWLCLLTCLCSVIGFLFQQSQNMDVRVLLRQQP